jgi:nucleoside-triphosphatase THEP1
VLKNIADVERARQDTLQKAGYYDNVGMADEIAKMEKLGDDIKQFLKEVVKKYPETTSFIMEGIRKIYNEEPTIEGEVIA